MINFNTAVAVWFLPIDKTSDYLAAVQPDGDSFSILWRVRYYSPINARDPFCGEDVKNWYQLRGLKSADEGIAKIRTTLQITERHAEGPLFEVLRGERSAADFMAELVRQPWMFAKDVSADSLDECDGATFRVEPDPNA